ncbi:hypothetical protein [Kamptonema formosum]|uniref:hypothetical protein n=1 Tax=Kamptonema formosum TaxID=331992 RepID=UPI00034629F7|nr:hypothetical protein [Oscillatoria sp. PCC 10802]
MPLESCGEETGVSPLADRFAGGVAKRNQIWGGVGFAGISSRRLASCEKKLRARVLRIV